MFSISVFVNDEWISPVYDHVHHGKMLSLFELARLGFVESIGFPNDQLIAQGKLLVVTGVTVSYKREVKRGSISVTCDRVSVDARTIRIAQRIVNERNKVAVEAQVSLMFMDPVARRGIDVPGDFRDALEVSLPR
jgi:thioesterase-3